MLSAIGILLVVPCLLAPVEKILFPPHFALVQTKTLKVMHDITPA